MSPGSLSFDSANQPTRRASLRGTRESKVGKDPKNGRALRLAEAAPALAELQALWTLPVEDLRVELIERHAIAPEPIDRLMEGSAKAGLAGVSGP